MLKKLWQRLNAGPEKKAGQGPRQVAGRQQGIQVEKLNVTALDVVRRLQRAGYEAYWVGGSVRDLLLGRLPKDYDVATNATPSQVRRLFRKSRVIGRRFKLVHVYGRDETIEVSTFRADVQNKADSRMHSEEGMIISDNVFGSLDEDAWRRDFTVNAFYYDPEQDVVLDHVGGLRDLKKRHIRTIGDPQKRFQEDPIRLLRALRFAAKLDFSLERELEKVLQCSHQLLAHVPGSRLYDAFLQVFFAGYTKPMYDVMQRYGYFAVLFEKTAELIQKPEHEVSRRLIDQAMISTDERFHKGKSLNPGFLLSVILWPALQEILAEHLATGMRFHKALHLAVEEVLVEHQASLLVLPARMVAMIRQVWLLQFYLKQRRPSRIEASRQHRYFRAAYDFLEMRAALEPKLNNAYQWWRRYQQVDEEQQQQMVSKLKGRR